MGCCSWCSDLDKKRCWAFLELPKQMNVLDTILIIFLLNSQGATGLFALQLNSCIWLTGQTLPFRNRGVRSDVVTHISNRTKKTSPIGPYKVQRSWSGGSGKPGLLPPCSRGDTWAPGTQTHCSLPVTFSAPQPRFTPERQLTTRLQSAVFSYRSVIFQVGLLQWLHGTPSFAVQLSVWSGCLFIGAEQCCNCWTGKEPVSSQAQETMPIEEGYYHQSLSWPCLYMRMTWIVVHVFTSVVSKYSLERV